MKTKIKIIDYPESFGFETSEKLPDFKYGCEKRSKILEKKMQLLDIKSPNHEYSDYIVETVHKFENYEYWYLGS